MFKYLRTIAICLILGIVMSWFVIRDFAIAHARQNAAILVKTAYEKLPHKTDDEKIIAIATEVHKEFKPIDPVKVPLLRLRPYLSNSRTPDFLKLPSGTIESILKTGLCDNAVRMLAFTLKQQGYETTRWNMISNVAGHAVLVVTTADNRKIFVDPLFGFVATDEKHHLIDIVHAQKRIQNGANFADVFIPLAKDSDPRFYDNIKTTNIASRNDDLIIEATLPDIQNKPVYLGQINGDTYDVRTATQSYKMTSFWNYVGHEYNRKWVRILKTNEPVRVEMTLTALPEKGIMTASPAPVVQGKTLSWTLDKGQQIVFRDGLAKISPMRLNSYIGVDQIALYPVQ